MDDNCVAENFIRLGLNDGLFWDNSMIFSGTDILKKKKFQ